MKKQEFINTILLLRERQEEERRKEQFQKVEELKTRREEEQKKTTKQTSKKLFKRLEEQYKPIYCYNVYDLQDNELLIAQFNNLNDLLEYVNKYENSSITLSRLKHIIKEKYIINDRFEIIKDKFQKIAFLDDLQRGLNYEN